MTSLLPSKWRIGALTVFLEPDAVVDIPIPGRAVRLRLESMLDDNLHRSEGLLGAAGSDVLIGRVHLIARHVDQAATNAAPQSAKTAGRMTANEFARGQGQS